LLENFVTDVLVLNEHLFINYFEAGVTVTNPQKFEEEIEYHLTAERVVSFCRYNGEVNAITDQGDIYRYDFQESTFKFAFKSKVADVVSIHSFDKMEIVVSDSSVLIFSKEGELLNKIETTERIVHSVLDIKDQKLFAVASTGNLYAISVIGTGELLSVYQTLASNVMGLTLSNDGRKLFVPTRSDGFYVYEVPKSEASDILLIEHLQEKNGLVSNSVKLIYMDAHGNSWIGGYGDGLSVLPSVSSRTLGLNSRIYSLTQHGESLFATDGNSLFEVIPRSLSPKNTYEMDAVGSIRILRSTGEYLVCVTEDNRVYLYDTESNRVIQEIDLGDWDPIRINEVKVIGGQIIMLTEAGVGFHRINDNRFKVLSIVSGLPSNRALSCTKSHDNENIVIGLDGAGLVEIDSLYNVKIMDVDVVNYRINSLLRSDRYNCFTTIGEGLFCEVDGIFESINELDNNIELESFLLNIGTINDSLLLAFSSKSIQLIQQNKRGKLSISKDFTDLDISSPDYSVNAGKLTYISNHSLSSVNISNNDDRLVEYFPITITDIKLNGNRVPESRLTDIVAGDHRIRFDFISPQFSSDLQHIYEYKLDGFEGYWNLCEPGASHMNYPNISSGEYRFRVRLLNRPESEVSISLTVQTPLWKRTWFVVTVSVIVLGLLIFGLWIREVYNNNLKSYLKYQINKRTTQLEEQSLEISHQNQEILDSIIYAKRLQSAILPKMEQFDSLLEEVFVLYIPKDIVAGDFYWLHEQNGNVLFAAADCTGHGVPGAMVSVVCHNALNQSVNEYKLETPSHILDQTAMLVDETFARSGEDVKDGMDISLCGFNRESRKLSWAGAYNPIWIVTERLIPELGDPTMAVDNCQLYEIKADKQPIGRYPNRSLYTNHELILEKGDCFYVFTDGFPDQFGGPKGRKFMYKSFKQLLMRISSKPMSHQQVELNNVLSDWMGELEQVDDILIIGNRA